MIREEAVAKHIEKILRLKVYTTVGIHGMFHKVNWDLESVTLHEDGWTIRVNLWGHASRYVAMRVKRNYFFPTNTITDKLLFVLSGILIMRLKSYFGQNRRYSVQIHNLASNLREHAQLSMEHTITNNALNKEVDVMYSILYSELKNDLSL